MLSNRCIREYKDDPFKVRLQILQLKTQDKTFIRFVLSSGVLFRFLPGFCSARTTNLAVTATQIFEFADEGFCQAQVPLLR
jgi:TctA family transporter